MSKRLAFAVATAAELSVTGDAIAKSNNQPSPTRSALRRPTTTTTRKQEELKQQLGDFSPTPLLSDSDDDDLPATSASSASIPPLPVPVADPRYLSEHELLNLQPLPTKSPRTITAEHYNDSSSSSNSGGNSDRSHHSSSSSGATATGTSFRHRTSLYVDSRDGNPTEVFCCAFSTDGRYLAVGCGDGTTRVYNTAGQLRHIFQPKGEESLPVTCVRFRPASASAFSSLIHVLMVTSADGTLAHYHLSSTSSGAASVVASSNQLFTCAYAASALSYAAAGRDASIRLYDEQTRKPTATLQPLDRYSGATSSGHSNRIYAIKYSPVDDNTLFSAGWDNTVQVWDVRTQHAIHSLYGPHVCGDSLDVSADGKRLLVGSWRQSSCLEVWEWSGGSGGSVVESVVYNSGSEAGGGGKSEMLYAACWSGDGQWMAAGGCGSNDAKIRRVGSGAGSGSGSGGESGWEERIGLKGGVYSVAISADSKRLAVAGADANVIIVDL